MKLSRKQIYLLLAAVTFMVFGWALNGESLLWDDDFNVWNNRALLSGDVAYFWTTAYYGLYIPLSYTVWWFLSTLASPPEPSLFHGANILLHLFNVFQVYELIRLLQGSSDDNETPKDSSAALVGALVFCVHPLQVGAVAWISGLRDLLSAAFALYGARLFLGKRSRSTDIQAILCFVLGMLAKPSVIALPLALFSVEFFFRRRNFCEVVRRVAPFFAVALPILYVNKSVQPDAQFTHWVPPFFLRFVVALDALGFYVSKIFWPWKLAVDYGRSPEFLIKSSAYGLSIAVLAVAGAVVVWTRKKGDSWTLTSVLWMFAFLLPVQGFVPFAFQAISTVADHYMYLPMVGVAWIAAHGFSRLKPRRAWLVAGVILCLLAGRSLQRIQIWKSNSRFYTSWMKDNPLSTRGYVGLASVAFANNDFVSAEALYRKALSMNPLDPVATANLGQALLRQNQPDKVLLEIEPRLRDSAFLDINRTRPLHMAGVYRAVALAQEQKGLLRESYSNYCKTIALSPSDEISAEKAMLVGRQLGLSVPLDNPCSTTP